jgi:hypothetical protein
VEPERSLPHLQEPATCPCSVPDQSNSCSPPHPTSWRSILILPSRWRLFQIIIIIIIIWLLSLLLYCNSEIRERERALRLSRDHVLSAGKLQIDWLFPLHPRYRSRSTDCLSLSPGDPGSDRITGEIEGHSWPKIFRSVWGSRFLRVYNSDVMNQILSQAFR